MKTTRRSVVTARSKEQHSTDDSVIEVVIRVRRGAFRAILTTPIVAIIVGALVRLVQA